MRTSPTRRWIALLLAVQPTLWMSGPAFAQSLEDAQRRGGASAAAPPPSSAAPTFPSPIFPTDADPAAAATERLVPRVVAVPLDAPLDPDQYLLGHGDVLELSFWGVQNFRLRTTVDMEGRAFVPKVGYFELRGRSLSDARRVLRQSASRNFPRLSFDVTLSEPRTFLVQVVDDVVAPGAYPARAVERVSTLIARAGGFGRNASRRRVEVRRRDGSTLQADLLRYGQTGDVRHNPLLLDGDVVRVPFEELAATIEGAVNRPGRYELVGTRDLAELVELAGGLAPGATRALPVTVVRRGEDDRELQLRLELPAEGLPAAPLRHEDVVRVAGAAELQRAVLVIGALAGVKAPEDPAATRRLPFVEGESVRTLLERVGGPGPLADLAAAHLVRGGAAVPVDLHALVVLRDLSADRPVELGDTLVVPWKRREILVGGAVFKPGPYPYNPAFGVEQYLRLAGGPNRFGRSIPDVRVIGPTGQRVRYREGMTVEPGSTLVMPERNFSPTEIVQIVLSTASVLVSGIAVVLAARR